MVKKFTLRIEDDLLDKLHFVAQYEDRTAASLARTLIRECVKAFEAKHGIIEIDIKNALANDGLLS